MHKISLDFQVLTDRLISVRRPYLMAVKKKKKKKKKKKGETERESVR